MPLELSCEVTWFAVTKLNAVAKLVHSFPLALASGELGRELEHLVWISLYGYMSAQFTPLFIESFRQGIPSVAQ
jgi:hypothetical protein